jgi:hypothetical protein
MIDPRTSEEKLERMEELMKPVEIQLMMCDDLKDQLMMASCFMVFANDLFIQHLGEKGAKNMFNSFVKDHGYDN